MLIQKNELRVVCGDTENGQSTELALNEKNYEAPVLIHHGDVRDVTLGPTVGIGESGNELGRRP